MKKYKKLIITTFVILMLLLSLLSIHFFTYEHDKVAINNGNPPSYALPVTRHKDGGSIVYFGIGYQVLRWHTGLDTGERKIAYEIYKYPNYKEWEEGPEPTSRYFAYKP